MKEDPFDHRPVQHPRLSLEQKIMLMVHRYRAAEKRRKQQEAARSKRLRMIALFLLTAILLPSLVILFGHSTASGAQASFSQADQALASGYYAKAAGEYEHLIARQGYSEALLFDLGNAFYREGKWGWAILNYERALWLSPRDSAAVANLALARQHAGLTKPALNLFERAARVASADTFAWLGSAALALLALGLVAGRLLGPAWRQKARATALVSGVVLAVSVAGLGYWWTRLDQAVVLTPNSTARVAPAAASPASFDLREGQVVQERKSYGGFVLIRTADGRGGWLAQSDLARIVPLDGRAAATAKLQTANSLPDQPPTTALAPHVPIPPKRGADS